MKAKAISFTPEVLKAKLRTLEQFGVCETRRPCKRAPETGWAPKEYLPSLWDFGGKAKDGPVRAPFGGKGQILWVRERARVDYGPMTNRVRVRYEIDGKYAYVEWPDRMKAPPFGKCIPNGVHREGARHFLEVVNVKAERLHDVTEEAAQREGFATRMDFLAAFYGIYGGECAATDPWVFAYTLKRVTP